MHGQQNIKSLNPCPSLNTRDQDCKLNKQQVKLLITYLNHCVCIQETERFEVYFTLTESHILQIHIKYHKDITRRNGMQKLWKS